MQALMKFVEEQMRQFKVIPWISKIVDDIIIYTPDVETLFQRIPIYYSAVLITISKKKLQVGDSVKFAGFLGMRGPLRVAA